MGRASEPKYITLKTEIQRWIDEGELRPGEQLPTEMELANRFEMSRQTVRMAMNELVYEQVLVRQQGRGTFVAERMNATATAAEGNQSSQAILGFAPSSDVVREKGLTRTVAVVTTYMSDYIFPAIIKGIEGRLSDAGFSLMLFNTDNSFEKETWVLDNLLARAVDGVIVEPTRSAQPSPNLDRYLKLLSHGVPMVALHSAMLELCIPCVRMDDEEGGLIAVQHLSHLGHVQIGAIMKRDDMQGRLRFRGMLKGMREAGIGLNSDGMLFYDTDHRDVAAERFVQRWSELPESHRPSAIVCYNDEIAMLVKRHFTALGISIPGQISIVSFDDSDFAQVGDITSVQHPKYEMGCTVADTVLSLIRSKAERTSIVSQPDYVFPAMLSIRNSSNS